MSMADGPQPKPRTPGMREALAALDAELRRPTPADAPPPSTFPMTRAAKAALGLAGGLRHGRRLAPWRKPDSTRTEPGQDERPAADTGAANPHGSSDPTGNERGTT